MSEYEEKKKARIERYRKLSEKASQEAQDRFNSHNINAVRDMGGEPIKIGHHSERRHRRLIEKADNDMRKGVEAGKKAEYYEDKANAAECSRAVSSDDPDAIVKLQAKIESSQKYQDTMKAANRILRKKISDEEKIAALVLLDGIKDESTAAKVLEPDVMGAIGFPHYALTNNNANIKRMEKRVLHLQRLSETENSQTDHDGFHVVENAEQNRIQFIFPGKPDEEIRSLLKKNGFRFSHRNMAWQRHLNNAGRFAVNEVIEQMSHA